MQASRVGVVGGQIDAGQQVAAGSLQTLDGFTQTLEQGIFGAHPWQRAQGITQFVQVPVDNRGQTIGLLCLKETSGQLVDPLDLLKQGLCTLSRQPGFQRREWRLWLSGLRHILDPLATALVEGLQYMLGTLITLLDDGDTIHLDFLSENLAPALSPGQLAPPTARGIDRGTRWRGLAELMLSHCLGELALSGALQSVQGFFVQLQRLLPDRRAPHTAQIVGHCRSLLVALQDAAQYLDPLGQRQLTSRQVAMRVACTFQAVAGQVVEVLR
ncbi:hypothetical protein D3C81_1250660 [compost metagenome]